jgi:hypothetical protein
MAERKMTHLSSLLKRNLKEKEDHYLHQYCLRSELRKFYIDILKGRERYSIGSDA